MALDFGDHPNVVFKAAPLRSVLCQVRFPAVLSLMDEAGVAGFQEALRLRYPEFHKELMSGLRFASLSPPAAVQSAPVWRMRDEAGWQVSLAVDFVSLDTSLYTYSEDFCERLAFILDALNRTVHPAASTRLGVRKVNALSHSRVHSLRDWTDLLDPTLVGLAGEDLPGEIRNDRAQLEIADDDEGTLVIRHGMDAIEDAHYVIDVDYWNEKRLDIGASSAIMQYVENYSAAITGFFHHCLSRELYNSLRPEPRPPAQ